MPAAARRALGVLPLLPPPPTRPAHPQQRLMLTWEPPGGAWMVVGQTVARMVVMTRGRGWSWILRACLPILSVPVPRGRRLEGRQQVRSKIVRNRVRSEWRRLLDRLLRKRLCLGIEIRRFVPCASAAFARALAHCLCNVIVVVACVPAVRRYRKYLRAI
jgi:hypothetical protein